MSLKDVPSHGNLASYRTYTGPVARELYGYAGIRRSKHQKNICSLLHILFMHGKCTTWEMAQTHMRGVPAIREQEKSYRRLLVGRTDRSKRSSGLMETGLVVRTKYTREYADSAPHPKKGRPYYEYRLSLHGILYCIEALEPDNAEIDVMAIQYAGLLPMVFGRWRQIRSVLGADTYGLRILASSIFLDGTDTSPLYELMSYIHTKYQKNFESISEEDLAEQISYWFYTHLLHTNPGKLKRVMRRDAQLGSWYNNFVGEARQYYLQRAQHIRNVDIL